VTASAAAQHDQPVDASSCPSQPLTAKVLRRPVESAQYTSLAFGRRLQQVGLVASMGTVGDALDNAVTESFFATLECELLDRYDWPTRLACEPPCSTSSRSSTSASVATPPWTTTHPSTTSTNIHHPHPPHSQRVHESGQLETDQLELDGI
jgi:transposase InsO family protein